MHLHVDDQICTMSGEALERSQEQNTASALDQTANKTLNIVLNANCISWGKDVLWDQSLQGERSCSRNSGKIFHVTKIQPFDRAAPGIHVTLR